MSHLHPTYEAVVSGIKASIPIAELLAATTTTKWDDQIVGFAKTVMNNESLLKWFHDLICHHEEVVTKTGPERTGAIHAAMEATAPVDGVIRKLLEQLGLTWEQVKTYAPYVLRLLFTLLGYRS